MSYVSQLLANPGRPFPARELAEPQIANGNRAASIDAVHTSADLGDAGVILDAKARGQYRRRIAELREEVAEAVRINDTSHATLLRSEMEALRDQLAAAVGLGGRSRKAASHTERARLMVTKAIKAAIAKIRASDASMGRYLATSIKTGNYCAYDPDPVHPITWQL
jgi:non-specific serine/threonine protein kinase